MECRNEGHCQSGEGSKGSHPEHRHRGGDKIKMAMGSMEGQIERSHTNVDSAKTEFVQLDQERQAEMDQAVKVIKQHEAALDAMVGEMHVDMETTTSDMRNVQADATNKLEAIQKSKDDMAAKVEELKELHIDIVKYVEKKSREGVMGSERCPSPGTDTHNFLHKKCAGLEQLDRVHGAFSTELKAVKNKTTNVEEELSKVENKISVSDAAGGTPSCTMGLTSSTISAEKLRTISMSLRTNWTKWSKKSRTTLTPTRRNTLN